MAAIWTKSDGAALGLAIEPVVQDIMAARRALVASTTAGICMRFQVGQCHRGNACPQRHIRIEKSVCKHWLRGLCKKGDLCEFLHEYDLSKMPPCHFFLTFGKCSNPECPFLHVKPEDVVRDCPWYARGFCKQGPNCKNRHVRVVACPKYLAGFCPDGPNCKLGHAKHEIPDIEPVMSHSAAQVRQHYTPDHKAKQSQSTVSNINRPLSEVRCFKCGEMGHYANHCPNQRRPAPPGGFGAGAAGNAPIKDPRAAAAAKAGITPDRVKAVAGMLGLNADVLMASGIDITLLEGPQGRQIAAQAGLLHPSNALPPGAGGVRGGAVAAGAGAGAGPYAGGAPPAGAGAGAAGFYGGAAPYPGGATSAPVAKKLQAMEF